MSDPNAPPDPDATLPPEYQPDPTAPTKDGLMQVMESDETAKELAEAKAAQDKLAADEKAVEDDPKVKVALVIDFIRGKLDEIAPVLDLVPGPIGDAVRVVKVDVDLADDLLAKIGL